MKYKLSKGEWDRADLYEVIAFAEAYRASQGLILRFREPGVPPIADLSVGAKTVHEVTWRADPSVDPVHAAHEVAEEVAHWIGEAARRLSA